MFTILKSDVSLEFLFIWLCIFLIFHVLLYSIDTYLSGYYVICGNPLQCSCLENPRDGGAWWAAVYGVTQS